MSDFAPEQIASDREIDGKATAGPWEFSDRGDGSATVMAAPYDVDGLPLVDDARCPYMRGEVRLEDGEFCANARTRFPLALDEIERLQNIIADRDSFIANHAHATALERKDHEAEIERLQKLVPSDMWMLAVQIMKDEHAILKAENAAMSEALASLLHWMRGLRPTGAGSPGPLFTAGMGMIAEACEKKADEVSATLSDAVARGKKLIELERRDTPVVVRAERFRYACSACDAAVDLHNKFCRNCGRKLAWQ